MSPLCRGLRAGREVANPGAATRATDPADGLRPIRATDSQLGAPWHPGSVRRAQRGDRRGDRPMQGPASGARLRRLSARDRIDRRARARQTMLGNGGQRLLCHAPRGWEINPARSSFPSPTITSVAKSRVPIPRIISVSASSWVSTTGFVNAAPVSHAVHASLTNETSPAGGSRRCAVATRRAARSMKPAAASSKRWSSSSMTSAAARSSMM